MKRIELDTGSIIKNRYFAERPVHELVSLVKTRLNDTIAFADGALSVYYNNGKKKFVAAFVHTGHTRYRYTENCPEVSDRLIGDTLTFLQQRISGAGQTSLSGLPGKPQKYEEANTARPVPLSPVKTGVPEIAGPIKANTLVWVRINTSKRLALVVSGRAHAVVVRMYLKDGNKFSFYPETVALRLVQRAELSNEEIQQIACGKHILTKNKALQLVAVNFVFTDVEKRKERRVYYCTRCRAFHTTSMRWLPKAIRDKLRLHPFPAYLERTGKSNRDSETIHHWLRDDIGLKIGQKMFVKTLYEFEPDYYRAMHILLSTPAKYVEFVLYEFFHYKNAHNEQLLEL